MKELLTPAQASAIFGVAPLVLGPALGAAAYAWRKDRRVAVGVGAPLFLVGLLWWVYSAITSALGLESLLNLIVNFALFIAVGAGLGVVWRRGSAGR